MGLAAPVGPLTSALKRPFLKVLYSFSTPPAAGRGRWRFARGGERGREGDGFG
jgi:hypothetical protein